MFPLATPSAIADHHDGLHRDDSTQAYGLQRGWQIINHHCRRYRNRSDRATFRLAPNCALGALVGGDSIGGGFYPRGI